MKADHTHTLWLGTLFTLDLQSGSQWSGKQHLLMFGRRSDIQFSLAFWGGGVSLCLCICVNLKEDLLVDRVCSRSKGELSAGPLSPLRSAPASYPVSRRSETWVHSVSDCFKIHAVYRTRNIHFAVYVLFIRTLMSSGRFTSSLFSCSFFWIVSRLLSTGGFGTFSCWGFFSSWEPKLLGSVLLRWRVRGGRSSSDFISLFSDEEEEESILTKAVF